MQQVNRGWEFLIRTSRALVARRWFWFVPILAAIVPAWMAFVWSVQVPYADYWFMVLDPYLAWQDGGSLWETIHMQVLHSRIDAARTVHFALVGLTGMDLRIEPLFSLLFSIVGVLCIIWTLRRTRSLNKSFAWVAAALITLLWLTPDRTMNWTYGVLVCWDMEVAALLVAGVVMQQPWPIWRRLLLASALAFTACHCLAFGWMIWGLLLAWLAWEAIWKKYGVRQLVVPALIWVSGLGATLFAFSRGYLFTTGVEHSASLAERFAKDWTAFGEFFLTLIGMPLAKGWSGWGREGSIHYTEMVAPWIGAAAIVLFVALIIKTVTRKGISALPEYACYVLLGFWSLGCATLITLARTGTFVSNSFESRYLAVTLVFQFGILGLFTQVEGRQWRYAKMLWLGVVSVGYLLGFANGLNEGKRTEMRYRTIASAVALRHCAPEPCYLDAVEPGAGTSVISHLDGLEKRGLLAFKGTTSDFVDEAFIEQGGIVTGAIKTHEYESGRPVLNVWAVNLDERDAVDAVVISCQTEGQREQWMGLAQRRLVSLKTAARHKVHVPESRIGWSWGYKDKTQQGFLSEEPNPIPPKPLPTGTVTFRAYAYDVKRNVFTKLDGVAVITVPGPESSPLRNDATPH